MLKTFLPLINKAAHFEDVCTETPRTKTASSRSYRRWMVELVEGTGALPPSNLFSLPPSLYWCIEDYSGQVLLKMLRTKKTEDQSLSQRSSESCREISKQTTQKGMGDDRGIVLEEGT